MSEFIDYLHEVFSHFGPIETRRMFGGYGVYHDGLMFALVANDVVYLKADTHTARYFDELGLAQFEYQRQGKKMNMSYYLAPEEIFDDPDLARQWAVRAFEAALRARKNRRTEVSRRAKNQSKINGVRHD